MNSSNPFAMMMNMMNQSIPNMGYSSNRRRKFKFLYNRTS